LGAVAISLSGGTAAIALLSIPTLRATLDAFGPLEGILGQLGATFGTILALVLTLSILPIQRAGEVWSPAIVRLYRHDSASGLVFAVFGLLCVGSFLFAIKGLAGLPVSAAFATAIALLGMSLDLLRWYHAHICQLLDPREAVTLVTGRARRTIDQMQAQVSKVAALQRHVLEPAQQEQLPTNRLEFAIYQQLSSHPSAITFWIQDLSELAVKAVGRGDGMLAASAVLAIADVTNHYLSARRSNLILVPAPEALFLAQESDVRGVTAPAYEALKAISRKAVDSADHSTALRVSEAFQNIAVHTARLGAPAFRDHTAPLTYAPLAYLTECLKYAQAKSLDEVSFQSADILASVVRGSPANIDSTDICIPVVDGLANIALHFYVKRNGALAEHVVGHIPTVLDYLLSREDFYFDTVLRHSLEKIEPLVPIAMAIEATAGRFNLLHALARVYPALGQLFEKAVLLVRVEPGQEWVNPYNSLVELLDKYSTHFRRVGERNEFGESFLLWEITYLIKRMATVIAYRILDHPARVGHGDEQAVVSKFQWVLSFLWVAFAKKKNISQQRLDEAGEALAYTGLLFYAHGFPNVLESCVSHIGSNIRSYCEATTPPDYYVIGDLATHFWALRRLTEQRGDDTRTSLIDTARSKKPQAVTDPQWKEAQEAIERRRQQFEERLADRNGLRDPHSVEGLLGELLGGQ
jgi:hypothetical protein